MKKYLNNKGSAMVLVLSSLIILTAVGGVIVLLSAANITMSKAYSNWSEDYYWLDYAAQKELAALDKNTLLKAEKAARYYLQNGYYVYTSVSADPESCFPSSSTAEVDPADAVTEDLQDLLHEEWDYIYSQYSTINPLTGEPLLSETQYVTAIENYTLEAFKVIYCSYLDKNLSSDLLTLAVGTGDSIPDSVETSAILTNSGWFPSPSVYNADEFGAFYSAITELPKLSIIAKDNISKKQVDVAATVIEPSYEAVDQTKFVALNVNPLYTNAISARGEVQFSGSGGVTVNGDVVANNLSGNSLIGADSDGYIQEGQLNGVRVSDDTNVVINGNVYTSGDVHIFGDGSSLTVNGYSVSTDLKTKLYKNNYFFDPAASGDETAVNLYNEDNAAALNAIPFFYNDINGGNIYCNNLAIESVSSGSSLFVSGNVWTQDDIQNDGDSGSSIYVSGNYIGMHSDAHTYIDPLTSTAVSDPNGSSSVINNAYLQGSDISLGGNYIIPGVAYYIFSENPIVNRYYQTAESGTSRAGEFFQAYSATLTDISLGDSGTYSISPDESYILYKPSSDPLNNKITRFKGVIGALMSEIPGSVKSGINVSPSSAYSLGVVVNADGTIIHNEVSDYIGNNTAYSELSAVNDSDGESVLSRTFKSKALYYGTAGNSFSDLINNSYAIPGNNNGFYYYSGSQTLFLDGTMSGILFCSGNLTLSGTGTFRGSIVCAGNVTVNSGVTVTYDETAIKNTLGVTGALGESQIIESDSGSSLARRFFSPPGFSMGDSLGIEKISSASANTGERMEGKRYIVNSWKEKASD